MLEEVGIEHTPERRVLGPKKLGNPGKPSQGLVFSSSWKEKGPVGLQNPTAIRR